MISLMKFDFYYIVFIPLGIYIEVTENVSVSSFCAFGDDNNSLESCEAKSRSVCAFKYTSLGRIFKYVVIMSRAVYV